MQSRQTSRPNEPIAVVGIGCRFAHSPTPATFWKNLLSGMDAIVDVPKDRFDIDTLYDPRPAVPGRAVTRWGSFIDDVHAFDHAYFGLSPREARRMDPQQRVLLEVSAEALHDACLSERALADFDAGVFIGSCHDDWGTHTLGDPDRIDLYTCTGATRCTLSGRISFAFNLQGPSMTVDAGCASSLLSIHLACQSLWSGETTLALAGGVNLILEPGWTIGFSQARMLSPDGHCKAFDESGDGFVRADGCGIVVLMPLSRAEQYGAPIYAVIRGSGASNDGASNGLLATPSAIGQAHAMRSAYRSAGLSPHDVQYIEAHGTGTAAGDPVEIAAISSMMQGRQQPCLVGSVKTNIGHTEGAAGVAGFIKTCLAVHHRAIPKSLHFNQPNPKITWDGSVRVADSLLAWPDGVARAGVSSFGISGTDVHVVLEEYRNDHARELAAQADPSVLCISSTSQEGLDATARAYTDYLTQPSAPAWASICQTAGVGRNHQVHRLAIVAKDASEAARGLAAFTRREPAAGVVQGRVVEHTHGPVFVFSGQGSQWAGMGAQLLAREPVFRRALEACDVALQPYTGWSVIDALTRQDDPRAQSIDVIQPTLFAMQVGLAALWRSLGVEPSLVIGHSMGEIAAAHLAGTLTLEDAACIVCSRSQLLKRTSGQGGMLGVELSFADAERAIAQYGGRVGVAVSNSPTSTVLSGEPELLEQLKAELERRDVFCRFIAADVAGHSPQLDPLLPDFARAIAGIRPNPDARALLFSTVAGSLLQPAAFDAAYWVRNLREPVRFSSALTSVLEGGYDTFVEVSPHPILLGPIQQIFSHTRKTGSVHASLRRDEDAQVSLRTGWAELHVEGHAVDFGKLFAERQPFAALPAYVWQRERFDADAGDIDRVPERGHRTAGSDGSLLGPGLASALHARTWFFESALSLQRLPYFADHKVRDAAILPGAAYIDMALTAASEVFGPEPLCLEDVRFERALRLSAEGTTRVQLAVHKGTRGASCKFFGADAGEDVWTPLATLSARQLEAGATSRRDLDALRAALPVYPVERHFAVTQAHGIEYGPGFRGIEALWLGEDSALAKVALPSCVPIDPQRQRASAALLDACWQAFGALVLRPSANDRAADAFLPVAIERIRQFRSLGTEVWVHAQLRAAGADAQLRVGDVVLCNAQGEVLMEVDGLALQRLAGESQDAPLERWLYELRWQDVPRHTRDLLAPARRDEVWLVLADRNARASSHVLRALRAQGAHCIEVRAGSGFEALGDDRFTIDPREPEHFARVLGNTAFAGVVHLWSLDAGGTDLEHAQELGSLSVAHVVQALVRAERPAPLFIVTQASQRAIEADRVTPAQAPVWALARVLRYEHPELAVRCIDLSATPNDAEWRAFFEELASPDAEDQLALRGAERFGMRLLRGASTSAQPAKASRAANFRLEIDRAGILDHLQLRAAGRAEPSPDEIEIEVCAAALNFLDVLKALGNCPGQTGPAAFGLECAGRISKLGANVRGWKLGQEVVAVVESTRTSISKYVLTHAALVVAKPPRLSFEQAVTIPVAFLTASYSLEYVGRLAAGERVLIHNAAGGVGLAAIALARTIGAEIFATAGNAQKRELLAELGVTYAGDSRSLAFADEIRARTSGEGVDVVLNALAGDAIAEGLALLRAQGRFLEIGKRDIYDNQQLGLLPFREGLTFSHIDIARLIRERPRLIGELLGALFARVERGELEPLPATQFPVSEAADAFRHMAQAAHVGKVVLSFDDPALASAVQPDPAAPLATDDGWYAISGGLGGLGLATASWLVDQGARQLVLLGRSAPSPDAQQRIAQLEAAGVRVLVRSCDVGDLTQLRAALDGAQPLRGVVHSAGVLDDGMTLQLTAASLSRVMRPKLLGAWNLHQLTRDLPLDFFVMYSSGAATLGSPGQGNYAAANAFLDALAHFRRDSGLPALSVDWGAWSEVGLAVRPDRAERLGERGLGSMTTREGLRVLEKLLRAGALNTTVFPAANWHTWTEFYPVAAKLPVFEALLRESSASPRTAAQSELQRILDAEPSARAQQVERYLLEQVSRVLKVARNKQLDPELALTRLGIDSLMALELKNRIEADLQVVVPVSKILLGPSARKLAHDVLEKLPIRAREPDPTLAEVAALSDAQVDALLGELLG